MTASAITVPQINVNETSVYVVEWLVEEGEQVQVGDIVVAVETSKAVVGVDAEAEGYLRYGCAVGVELEIGATLGWIDSEPGGAVTEDSGLEKPGAGVKATGKALDLAASHGLDLALLPRRGIITEQMVQKHLETRRDAEVAKARITNVTPLKPVQRAAMNAVVNAVREQAATHMLGEADVGAAEELLLELSTKYGSITNFNLTDLVIHQTARALREFPRLNATLHQEGVEEHDKIHVGFTMDVSGELYMAVLQDADTISLADIAQQRMAILLDMMRGNGHDAVSRRGTFSVTTLNQAAVLHQVPIIYPDQAAIFGVGGVRREIRVGADGRTPEAQSVVGLCISYDHRFINGDYAAGFLENMTRRLKAPQDLAEGL